MFSLGLDADATTLSVLRLLALVLLVCGCASSTRDRAWLDRQLHDRVGVTPCDDVHLDDGLSEPEVATLVLCRSPALRAEKTRIDAALATLDEARRPANPQLTLLGPLGPVTALATLLVPLESLWQMPSRAAAAARDADVTGEAVLLRALDLVRDARLLHIELGLSVERAQVRRELSQIAAEVARIAAVRAKTGDVSPMEERVMSAEAQTALDTSDFATTEVTMAHARLRAALALDSTSVQATFTTDVSTPPTLRALIDFARAARPDARSADLAISAATARAKWERSRVVNLSAQVEAHWNQTPGPAMRVGGRLELPIFHWNPGGIGRAEAEIERANALHESVARAVILDVTLALARFEQATRSRQRFEADVLPTLDAALGMAQRGFESGDQTYLVVLDVLRRTGEARLRSAELRAEQRRALCELERSIGARLQNTRSERGNP